MLIAAGSASQHLAQKLSTVTGAPLLNIEIKRFPDNECYVRVLDNITDEKVVIVNTGYPDPNVIETLLLQDAVREKASEVATIVPYLAYSRQDKIFHQGEALSARAMIQTLSRNTDHFGVLNLHKASAIEYSLARGVNIDTYGVIAEYLSKLKEPPDMIMGPDKGAGHIASSVAKLMGIEWDHLEKTRIDGETVEIAPARYSVDGRKVAIVDDIISTGGTIATATSRMKENGALKVYAICTHGLFIGQARRKLTVCDLVASTDSIETDFSKISAAQAVADHLGSIGFL
jgi:ribose-phosphate pyrophosphokinase